MTMVWHGNAILKRVEKDATQLRSCLARQVAKRAKHLVPVRTGALKGTIRVEEAEDVTTVHAGGRDEVDYAGKVELGTAKQAAQPYMRPAVEQVSRSDVNKCLK